MKSFFKIFAICFIISSSFLFAQKEGGSSSSPRTGNMALLFSVNQLAPGNYASGIGGKMYFSSTMAGRMGLGLQLGSDNTQIALSPSVTIDFLKSNPLTFYFGGGLSLLSASGANAQNPGMTVNLGGGLGAEWFIDKNVSLSAEYNVIYLSIFSPSNGDSQTTFGIGNFGQAILSFYF